MACLRVMDLPGWASQTSRSFSTIDGDVLPACADRVTIERLTLVTRGHVLFTCLFQGRSLPYDFPVSDRDLAKKIAIILRQNTGRVLRSIETVEIPEHSDNRGLHSIDDC